METINDRLYTTMCSEKTLQSDKNGFFLQIADHVIEVTGSEWLNEKFGKLKSDQERIEVLLADDKVKYIVADTLTYVKCIYRKKDAKVARDRRQDAEIITKTGILPKALMLLCQSVLRAPSKGVDLLVDAGRTLSLALWARSQVLGQLGEINAALNDLQIALKEGLPDRMRPEMYVRMAACYNALGEQNRAKISLTLAEKLYGKDRKADFENVKAKIVLKPPAPKTIRKCMPEITNGSNDLFEYASSLLELKENPEMGKYFVAKKHISTGDTLIVEPPRAACLLPENFGSHCHNCLQRLLAPVGCPDCVSVAFCSTECRDKALSTYHKFECKILDMLIGSGMSILCHIALRMITQEGLLKCQEIYKDRSLDTAQSLCRHETKREPKDFLQRSLMALFLLRCLQKAEFFPKTEDTRRFIEGLYTLWIMVYIQDFSILDYSLVMIMGGVVLSEEEYQVAELLSFSLQMLQFNAHEIYETRHAAGNRFKTSKIGYIGVGIYTTASLFNHDCYPGVMRYYVDRNMVIKASRPFKPGEIIPENYGPVFLMKSLNQRQRSLLSRYWFQCTCISCKEDWPLLDKLQNKHGRFRCITNNCDYLFSQPLPKTTTCPRCKMNVSFESSIEKMKYCEKQYKAGIALLDAQKPADAIPILTEAVDIFHSIASAPHKDTHLAQEALRTSFADSGNVYQCLVVNI